MGDVITRLKIESQEYDSKLKNAVRQMNNMEQQVRRTGASFAYADKEELAFVQSLGRMTTQATTAKGKIGELTTAFTELSVQYQNLTNEEKASPFGQAMAGSLQQLKGRINELNSQLGSAKNELGGVGTVAQELGSKLGIPTQMFTKMGPAVAAAAAAIKIASDAFKQNELIMDEWGRITQSAGSLYKGFLNAINTGDISGFLKNIGEIIRNAREAYNAMDRLGTFNAFNQINFEAARTGLTEAITNYREGTGSAESVRAAGGNLKQLLAERQARELAQYNQAIDDLASSRGVNAELLRQVLAGSNADYEAAKSVPMTGKRLAVAGLHTYTQTYAATEEEKLGEMLRKLNDSELENIQKLGAAAQATATEIEQVDKQLVRVLKSSEGKTAAPTAPKASSPSASTSGYEVSLLNLPEEGSLADLERQATVVRNSMQGATNAQEYSDMKLQLDGILARIREIKGETEIVFAPGSLNDLNQQLREAEAVLANLVPGTQEWSDALQDVAQKTAAVKDLQQQISQVGVTQSQSQDVKSLSTDWMGAAHAVAAFGSAMQSVEDPTAKVAGIVAQAIASVAAGAGGAIANAAKGDAGGPWGWLAFAIAATATMVGSIAAIKSATKYADGGMVGGNSYSGDNIVARLNSGEGVLTANGIQNASLMARSANPYGNMVLETYVSGEDLRIVLQNNAIRRGGPRNAYAIH